MNGSPALSTLAPETAGQAAARRLVRIALMVVGALLAVFGVLIAPLPGPFGLPIAVLGLMIVLRNSFWAKRRFVRLHRRHPRFVSPVRRLLRPGAPVIAVMWHQMLKTERLVLPPAVRKMRSIRRKFRARRARAGVSGPR
jgi:Flp pilus assembly protein TadB